MSDPVRPSALAGVRVLDLTQVMAGAYCSMLLADMGADVIKVERPEGGDDTRRMSRGSDVELSPAFNAMNRNKRGLAVDLKDPRGAEVVRRLARDADILVENFRPGLLERFGLGQEALRAENPALIYCSISGFGATGPYAGRGGYDLVAQAMSGLMSMTGEDGGAPAKVGVPICDLNAGVFAAYGVLSAYIHRLKTGEGQFVDTSLLEAGIAYTVWETAMFFATGEVARPMGSAHRLSAPYEALPTADGWIAIGAANQRNWERLCGTLGLSTLLEDPRFADNPARMKHRIELAGELATTLRRRTTAEWLEVLGAAAVPSGPLYDIEQVYADPHVQAREMVVQTVHPRMGTVRHIGSPVKLSATPSAVLRPAPLLGQHSREVLAGSGFAAAEIDELITAGVLLSTPTGEDPGELSSSPTRPFQPTEASA
ncbi:CaiB/BaiF CoA transferase family protein [Blastococcus saxobsidens]|uniref:Crotonobetainyl-CoA:carnitine CoA-transferase CaiB-like acyl-CoA transferase n=1 Tax=Blastococcus saxobsidens TaxID=138336 RepID=A0A4Q7Y6K5_9ACTN|nr:CoA transferase [Blastococcus saxobsidens]RZU32602.1 crotonobetainyl-CoA:carnitine CoA-transferase CaiB-like acyl-CoA transferase [Blastococcus saxobsidens]